jgi:hypothetical protein
MTNEKLLDLLREAAALHPHNGACGTAGYNPPFDGDDCLRCRIDDALGRYAREAGERKARLDRVWWDALHQSSREGRDLSESVQRADAAREREQGDNR